MFDNSAIDGRDSELRRWLAGLVNSLVDPKRALLYCRERFQTEGKLEAVEGLLRSLANDGGLAADKRKILIDFLSEERREPEKW